MKSSQHTAIEAIQHIRANPRSKAASLSLGAAGLAIALTLPQLSLAQQGTGYLEEVIVTAQRRAERSLDVPISITTIAGLQQP